jgi:hypothetical protein
MKNKFGPFLSEVFVIIRDADRPITAGEVFQVYDSNHSGTTRSRNEVAKRVSELAGCGAIAYCGKEPCAFSGETVSTWQVPRGVRPILSDVPAEPKAPTSKTNAADSDDDDCGCGCDCGPHCGPGCDCGCEEEDEDESAKSMLDSDDVAFLRQLCASARLLRSNPLSRLLPANLKALVDQAATTLGKF